MARPKLVPDTDTSTRLEIRLSATDKRLGLSRAKALGYGSLSEYIRAIIRNDSGQPTPARATLSERDRLLYAELNRIGINLKQITHHLNRYDPVTAEEIASTRQLLDRALWEVLQAV